MHYTVKFLTSFEQIIFFVWSCLMVGLQLLIICTCMYKEVHEKTVKFLKSIILYLIVSLLVEVHPNAIIETISLNVNFF